MLIHGTRRLPHDEAQGSWPLSHKCLIPPIYMHILYIYIYILLIYYSRASWGYIGQHSLVALHAVNATCFFQDLESSSQAQKQHQCSNRGGDIYHLEKCEWHCSHSYLMNSFTQSCHEACRHFRHFWFWFCWSCYGDSHSVLTACRNFPLVWLAILWVDVNTHGLALLHQLQELPTDL